MAIFYCKYGEYTERNQTVRIDLEVIYLILKIVNGVVSYRFNNYLNVGGIIQSLEGLNGKKKKLQEERVYIFPAELLELGHPSFLPMVLLVLRPSELD